MEALSVHCKVEKPALFPQCCKNLGAIAPQWEGVDDGGTVPRVAHGIERVHGTAKEEGGTCPGHTSSWPNCQAWKFFFLPPNTGAGLQPMGTGKIASFKLLYRRRDMDRLLLNVNDAAQGGQQKPDLKVALLMAVQCVFGM